MHFGFFSLSWNLGVSQLHPWFFLCFNCQKMFSYQINWMTKTCKNEGFYNFAVLKGTDKMASEWIVENSGFNREKEPSIYQGHMTLVTTVSFNPFSFLFFFKLYFSVAVTSTKKFLQRETLFSLLDVLLGYV